MFETLLQSVHAALSAVALTIILRNAPIIRGWVQDMKKPWACNVCMPIYTCALSVALLYVRSGDVWVLLSYLPSYVLAHFALEASSRPPNKPFIPPDFNEIE